MENNYKLCMPQKIYCGTNEVKQLVSILKGRAKRVAVFTDKTIQTLGLLDAAVFCIEQTDRKAVIFNEINPEPTCDEAQKIIDEYRKEDCDYIVAIGGGSVMDLAKLASLFAGEADGAMEYSVRTLLENPSLAQKRTPTVMIPTTAGTGAEATPNAIVAVPEKEVKVGIVNEEMLADYVILDAQFMKALPSAIAAATGVDALSHAVECFTSNKATPFSNLFALEAVKIIFENLYDACMKKDASDAKNQMLLAAFYGGAAITASGTTAVHALSYPLGGKYHIPHGVANAIMLLPVMKFNKEVCLDEFAAITDSVWKEEYGKTKEEKAEIFLRKLEELIASLPIPVNCSDYGIGTNDLEFLVEAGMGVQRLLANNKREVTRDDARNLYLEIM